MRDVKNIINVNPKNWLHKVYLLQGITKAVQYVKGSLLDIGCAEKPYEKIYGPLVSSYVGIDHPACYHSQTKIDVFASAMVLPFREGQFDTVLATQVLEHLPQPAEFFFEASRVLKAGGYLIVTAPHIWMLHEEPYDFYRYTKYGLALLSRKAGLKPLAIEPMGGFWVTLSVRLSYYLYDFFRPSYLAGKMINVLCRLIQLVGYEMDSLFPGEEDTHNYLLIAVKTA